MRHQSRVRWLVWLAAAGPCAAIVALWALSWRSVPTTDLIAAISRRVHRGMTVAEVERALDLRPHALRDSLVHDPGQPGPYVVIRPITGWRSFLSAFTPQTEVVLCFDRSERLLDGYCKTFKGIDERGSDLTLAQPARGR